MPSPLTLAVIVFEIALLCAGLALLWRYAFGKAAQRGVPSPLPPWGAPASSLLFFLLIVVLGIWAASIGAVALAGALDIDGERFRVLSGAAGQAGMLVAAAFCHFQVEPLVTRPQGRTASPVISGVVTFLIAWPVVIAVANGWDLLLEALGIPPSRQNLIQMFADAEDPFALAMMILLAVIAAPIGEELVFRAGLFRYFRTRIPRILALTLPGLVFASLHIENWRTLEGFSSLGPLTALAVIFSLAYERTGHIGTPIVAHALFNLNTVALILTGVGDIT
ncbi:MAG: CPBP family intramembrane glutamic endopeptidase [Opitutus sp.]